MTRPASSEILILFVLQFMLHAIRSIPTSQREHAFRLFQDIPPSRCFFSPQFKIRISLGMGRSKLINKSQRKRGPYS
jgi:hypothetical protein